jgi:hypothetical protein
MTHDALGGEDAAWLHMEDDTNPMVVNGVLELADVLPLERVYALLEHIAEIPRFRSRVVESAVRAGPPHWEELPSLALSDQVEHVTLEAGDDATFRDFIGKAVSGMLPRDRPLWRMYAIDRPGAGTTLLYRVHHAIGDGFALLGILLAMCEGGDGTSARAKVLPKRSPLVTAAGCAASMARIVGLRPDPRTAIKGPLGREKRVAWSDPLPLAEVKSIAHSASATVNDVLVATAAGALGRYLARHGETDPNLEVRAMIPVDLRGGAPPTDLGNRFGLVVLGMPVGISSPLPRLAAVKARMDRLKGSPEALATHALLRAMGWAPRPVENAGVWFFGIKASLVLTNVPGPRAPLRLAGAEVKRIMFWVPQSGRMGIGISIFSYAGNVTVGIIVDAGLVPDPEALVADLHAELRALRDAVGISLLERPPASSQSLASADDRAAATAPPTSGSL